MGAAKLQLSRIAVGSCSVPKRCLGKHCGLRLGAAKLQLSRIAVGD